jgi:hypothetical protein
VHKAMALPLMNLIHGLTPPGPATYTSKTL